MASRGFKSLLETVGLPPGTLVHVGEDKNLPKSIITIFDYDENFYEERSADTIEESFAFRDKPSVTWINIDGIQETDVIQKIQTHFNIHPLVLEDILNTEQRPKMEDHEEYIYLVLKMLYFDSHTAEIKTEQVSLILGQSCVISFQETVGDVFDSIRDRIRHSKGSVRKSGADYLAYALIDSIVDHYFVILELLDEQIEHLEDEITTNPQTEATSEIHQLKREMIFIRKQIWPLRELINGLIKSESPLIKKGTRYYLQDLYDHAVQVIDTIETFRDLLSGIHDVYLTSMSNKLNEVMRILTVISTIFMPLTFIVGVYGMNFKHMPELEWYWGYPLLWLIMISIGLGMILFFKRRKWL
jgi:magnesium transporter